MQYQTGIYSLLFGSVVIFALAVAALTWHRRHAYGSVPLMGLELSASIWSAAAAFEMAATSLAAKITWGKISYLGVAGTPLFFLLFAIEFGQQKSGLPRRLVALLSILPLLTIVIAFTNEWHHALWSHVSLDQEQHMASYGHDTLWFPITISYSYLYVVVALFYLYRASSRYSALFSRQFALLVLISGPPFVGNVVYAMGFSGYVDTTPIGFALSGAVFLFGLSHLQILDLVPVARSQLLEQLADGVLVLDAQQRVLDLNPAARRLINAARTVYGHPIQNIWPAWTDPPAAEVSFASRTVEITVAPLLDPRKQIGGQLVLLHDITERKRAEEALRRYATDLEASNAELKAFAHTAAHDLKNPINAMISLGEILLMDLASTIPEESITMLQDLTQRGYKAARIVDDLLMLATVRQHDVKRVPVNMGHLIKDVERRLIDLMLEFQPEIREPAVWPVAVGYGPWLEEVWFNYISNAIKYGGRPPIIELGADPLSNGSVRFWVKDNGPGLTPDEQSRLFIPFTRLNEAGIAGHGLGLSIVQRIIQRLDGQVGVESAPDHGSRFYFVLPCA
ncbi:MAG TPA: histidine kinase N-terminal 7TM domain-containing protein [Aggregatilineaceae bacterium]|nr:histidine kinase N-terminal 7TM domain-containing protein [Aggregatilineaceae bacterium]